LDDQTVRSAFRPQLDVANDLGQVFREEAGRVVATLIRVFGDIDLAEDAAQEAFAEAARTWPTSGLPPNPGGWLTTTARNRAIDRLRRESGRDPRQAEAARIQALLDLPEDTGPVPDDQLRLIFTCCHPALSRPTQVALTLRLLGGLETPEIARAFLVADATMAQRIVRAKQKIKKARIPYRIPQEAELPDRLRAVLDVLYLVFNEGHSASSGPDLVRVDLCHEAIRLTRVLAGLMPDEEEVAGLLALLLLTEARRPARTTPWGGVVLLADQDRGRWDADLVAEGQELVRWCLARNRPGPYQVQAAIAAVHSDAASVEDTDWRQVVALYDQLLGFLPTPVVRLNRAIAVAEVDGPVAALGLVDELDLPEYVPYHLARARFLELLGRAEEATEAIDDALTHATNDPERRFLKGRRDELAAGDT
jgi:RNA polymerase sigma-70 factor (ECF subfamily)